MNPSSVVQGVDGKDGLPGNDGELGVPGPIGTRGQKGLRGPRGDPVRSIQTCRLIGYQDGWHHLCSLAITC